MRIRTAVIAAAVVVLAIAGCSEEQRRDLGEVDIRDSLHTAVENAVENAGGDIDGDLDCTADITPEGVVSASCEGTTIGDEAITGTYEGTGDVEDEICLAALTITIGGNEVVADPEVTCFS